MNTVNNKNNASAYKFEINKMVKPIANLYNKNKRVSLTQISDNKGQTEGNFFIKFIKLFI